MRKNLVFDFGGVLMDWNPRYVYDPYFGDEAKSRWFLENICTLEWNSLLDLGQPFAQVVARRKEEFPEWAQALDIYLTRWPQMVGGEIPGTADVLKEAKAQGLGIYGLTNWSAETLPGVIAQYPIFQYFDGMVVSGEEGVIKPDPEIYLRLLKRYGLQAADCLFIDDRQENVQGALNVGMDAVLFTHAEGLRAHLLRKGLLK